MVGIAATFLLSYPPTTYVIDGIEGPIAFRRDKIPLDADTMASLSKQLETLAAAMDSSTAAGRRGVAQMLALATALDPSNASARELIAGFQNNIQPTPDNPDQVAKCQAKIWQYLGWLETSEAGDQGKALAACLADVIAVSEPKHPRSQALLAAGERGAWAGWIPSVSAYEAKSLAKIDEPVPATDPSAIKTPGITLTKAEVFTPLWQKTGKDEAAKWIIAPSPLQMAAQKIPDEAGKPAEFSITIRSAPDVGGMQAIANSLKNLLKKQYGKLPPGWSVVSDSKILRPGPQDIGHRLRLEVRARLSDDRYGFIIWLFLINALCSGAFFWTFQRPANLRSPPPPRELIKARHRPVVFITSNNEKELPDAFLRRCFFHYIQFPDKTTMEEIVKVHFGDIKKELLDAAMNSFFGIRALPGLKKKPTTSELLDWLRLLLAEDIPASALQAKDGKDAIPPMHGALLKNEQDVDLFQRLIFMAKQGR